MLYLSDIMPNKFRYKSLLVKPIVDPSMDFVEDEDWEIRASQVFKMICII